MLMTICEGSGHEDQPPAIRIQQQQLRSARQYRLVFQDQVPAHDAASSRGGFRSMKSNPRQITSDPFSY